MRRGLSIAAGVCLLFGAWAGAQGDKRGEAFIQVAQWNDIAWLEKIAGSLEAAAELKPPDRLASGAKGLRTEAYARLGAIGNDESLAAVKRIEAEARKVALLPERVPLGVWTHAYFGDSQVRLQSQVKLPDGTTYGVIRDWLYGDDDLLLVSSKTPEDAASWTRPVLLPLEGRPNLLSVELSTPTNRGNGDLAVRLSAEYVVPLPTIMHDADGDGWTDEEERRLGLDPRNADTDRDGVRDGADACPDFAPAPADEKDEEVQMIQRAVFAALGLSGARNALFVEEKARKVQFWGYGGPILYSRKRTGDESRYGGIWVSWEVKREGAGAAVVHISVYVGPLAAGGQEVRLKKMKGEWFVVERKATWFS